MTQIRIWRIPVGHAVRVLVAVGALVGVLAFPANGWAVEEDITPPEVNALSVSPISVDVTAESKMVTITATITDPAAPGGVSSGVAGGFITYSPPGGGTGQIFANFAHTTGDEFKATVTFPRFARAGTWTPFVRVVDRVGNFREYTAAQLEAKGFNAKVQVTSTPDTTPPVISNVTVGPPTAVTVSPPNTAQFVPAEATVTDDLSGVSSVSIEYRGPGNKHGAFGFLQHTTGNQFAGHIEFRPYQEAGSWSATRLQATDGVGNTRSITGAELAALNLPNIQVTSSPVDLEPPKLVSFSASAPTPCPAGQKGACVDAQSGDRTVTLKATVTDNLSGVSSFLFTEYVAPAGGQVEPLFVTLQKKSGNEFEGTVTIHRFSKAGFWKPSFMDLFDNAGNSAFLNQTELPEDAQIAVSRTTKVKVEPGGPPASTGETTSEINPIQSQLSVPLGGTGGEAELKITPRVTLPPPGFYLLNQQLDITAPTQPDASHPLKIVFLVDASVFTLNPPNPQVQFPPGCVPPSPGMPPPSCTLTVFKNGVAVAKCTAVPPGAIAPDPCIVEPQVKVGGETKLTIYSTTASSWNIGIPVTQGGKLEPTETLTSLSGGGHSGGTISVPEGTAVTDNATLTGTNASKATGKVSYNVYSDKACTKEITSAGAVEVTGGKVPASSAKTLPSGTYYWQASYSGDEANEKSSSACGSEVETVEGGASATPRLAKQELLADLEALVPSGNRDADRRIAKAVRDIKESLAPKLWIDDSHLTAKKGEEVFEEEREAIEHLRNLKGAAAGAVAGLVVELVEIDRTLAKTAIDEAKDPKAIAKATKEMEKAAEEIAESEPNSAIEHYQQAWETATKA
jgi:hypothetical protein